MKSRIGCILLAAIVGFCAAEQASALVMATDLGTGLPPATLGGYTMVPYDPGSIAGAETRTVGVDWNTWGQGYTGQVYAYFGDGPITLVLGAGTQACYFYEEPNAYADFYMTATDSSGVSVTTLINGYYGSAGVGFWTTGASEYLSTIVVTCTDPSGFAIGNFGINEGGSLGGFIGENVPDAGSTLSLVALALCGLGIVRARFGRAA